MVDNVDRYDRSDIQVINDQCYNYIYLNKNTSKDILFMDTLEQKLNPKILIANNEKDKEQIDNSNNDESELSQYNDAKHRISDRPLKSQSKGTSNTSYLTLCLRAIIYT
jgi:hypothetical protein